MLRWDGSSTGKGGRREIKVREAGEAEPTVLIPLPPSPLPLCLDNELNDCTLFHDHQRLSHSCMIVVFLILFHKQK